MPSALGFTSYYLYIWEHLLYLLCFQNHRQSGADITISCLPMEGRYALFSNSFSTLYAIVHISDFLQMTENYPYESLLSLHDSRASDFGLMKIDNKGRVLSFSEKPKGDDLKAMVMIFMLSLF